LWPDVAGHWAEDAIRRFAANGWMTGYPDGTFQPDRPMTRAEFVALVVKVLGLDAVDGEPFADTIGHWAQDAIAAAHRQGIVEGYDGDTFGPDDPLFREQMVAIVVKAFGLREAEEGRMVPFTDEEAISVWAREAVRIAASHGIVMGYEDGAFRPQRPVTRAEAVTILARALQTVSLLPPFDSA